MKKYLLKKLESSEVIDRVKNYNLQNYQTSAQEFLKKINPAQNNISSIYQVGSVGVPGISDIDYFIFFKDTKLDNPHKYYIRYLSDDSKYIFSHDGWFVDQKNAENLCYWFPFFDLDHIWGKKLNILPTNSETIKIFITLQYLISKVPSDFIKYSIKDGLLRERTMLAMVNSIRHTISLLKSIGISNNSKWQSFSEDYNDFRINWFNNNDLRSKYLLDYIADAILISYELIESLSLYMRDNWNISGGHNFDLNLNKHLFSFRSDWSVESALKNSLLLSRNEVPLEFGIYFKLWSKKVSTIGNYVRKSGPIPEFRYDKSIESLFKLHADEIEKYQNFNRKKFFRPGSGYHVLWCPYSDNFLGGSISKIIKGFQKVTTAVRT
jgi:hypothetical protein